MCVRPTFVNPPNWIQSNSASLQDFSVTDKRLLLVVRLEEVSLLQRRVGQRPAPCDEKQGTDVPSFLFKKTNKRLQFFIFNVASFGPLTEAPLPRAACWGSGDSWLHPWRLCVLLHLPLPSPVAAHLPGHAELCVWKILPALLQQLRAAHKNTGPESQASNTKWPPQPTAAFTHVHVPLTTTGPNTLFSPHTGLPSSACWIGTPSVSRCSFMFAGWAVTGRTVLTD